MKTFKYLNKYIIKVSLSKALFAQLQKLRNRSTLSQAIANFIHLFLLALLLGFASCKKTLEVGVPRAQLIASTVFQSEATANAVLSAAYLSSSGLTAGVANSPTILGARLADETDNYSTNQAIKEVANNQMISSNTYPTLLWQSIYGCIYQCNTILEGLKDNAAISQTAKERLNGESLFLRALCHFYATSLYGNVPIVTSTDYRINTLISQSSVAAVMEQVKADLLRAKTLLPADYSLYANERVRANKWAATALLARVYLYNGENQKAIEQSSEVIASPLFSLPPLASVFLKNSAETILQYKLTSTTLNTNEGSLFILTAKPTQTALKTSFYNGFETGDNRKTAWTGKVTSAGIDYYFPYKYKVKTGATPTEYSMMIRLAEMYLIRSEANARLNQLPLAIADLDVIRSRAGLAKIATTNPSISQSDLLDAILNERRSELFTEWAHRWMDLRRFGKLDAVMSAIKPGWKPAAQLLPIPYSEVLINQKLKQNLGY